MAAAEEATEPRKHQNLVLKISIHCKGCKKKVKKVLQTSDSQLHKGTVTGNVEADTLFKKFNRYGKHAELWPEPKPAVNRYGGGSGGKKSKSKNKKIKPAVNSQPTETPEKNLSLSHLSSMATPHPPSVVEAAEEIMRIHGSLPPRPSVEEVAAASVVLAAVAQEEEARIDEVGRSSKYTDIPNELVAVLQEARSSLIRLQSQSRRREAEQLLDLYGRLQVFHEIIQRDSMFVSSVYGLTADDDGRKGQVAPATFTMPSPEREGHPVPSHHIFANIQKGQRTTRDRKTAAARKNVQPDVDSENRAIKAYSALSHPPSSPCLKGPCTKQHSSFNGTNVTPRSKIPTRQPLGMKPRRGAFC